jgi:hypothetical protein
MDPEIKVKVYYDGKLNSKLDKAITEKMKSIGCKWYAQGTDLVNGIRDIAFVLNLED